MIITSKWKFIKVDDNRTSITLNNSVGEERTMVLNLSLEEFSEGVVAYFEDGAYIQNAWPMLGADEREFLQTGSTVEEWDEMSPEEDENNHEAVMNIHPDCSGDGCSGCEYTGEVYE